MYLLLNIINAETVKHNHILGNKKFVSPNIGASILNKFLIANWSSGLK